MTDTVVVLGAGYAGAGAIQQLEKELSGTADLVWISNTDYHLVLHESHRCIRDPAVQESIKIPIEEIKSPGTTFIEDEVVGMDVDKRVIELAESDPVEYDYTLVALGSQTAYYGIPGIEEHSLTLKSLDEALTIHERVKEAAESATRSDPAHVVVGGAGLSGIQTAGEVAEFRDIHNAPIEISLVEALEEIFPSGSGGIQQALREELEDAGVQILTNDPVTEADESTIHFDERNPVEYDVFVWTGGITGRDALESADVEKEHNRVNAESTFETSDERVFAIGDSAIIDQGQMPAPPTAQAAWQAAEVAGKNIARAIENRPLETWTHKDKGTVISIGEDAVASDVMFMPIETFGSVPAQTLKKFIAARWIADLTSWSRAKDAWSDL
ncbi:NAD(P)/FAD-dependent oxidoreductase [Natranaeroarchaeum sulfidigenes]|uniref:NADH dehydrogenase, FAD-containing subunit n=1 Tax=Natranaeroarchaeum sulfidigenes TaxID=2784880 RepID=A0A897MUM9_9EURY|nr:FAD-dependent oxidoreductase [Natranaeroarchaeum sulfidigenes]QSG02659.1 NADH dehydrogenase, FAD-containing subunit [Natranaeroarchaeum sulfidigenes]